MKKRRISRLLGAGGGLILAYIAVTTSPILGLPAAPILVLAGVYASLPVALFVSSAIVFIKAMTSLAPADTALLTLGLILVALGRHSRPRALELLAAATMAALVLLASTLAHEALTAASPVIIEPLLESRLGKAAVALLVVAIISLAADRAASVYTLSRISRGIVRIDRETLEDALRAEAWEHDAQLKAIAATITLLAAPLLVMILEQQLGDTIGTGISLWLALAASYTLLSWLVKTLATRTRTTKTRIAILIALVAVLLALNPHAPQQLLGYTATTQQEKAYIETLEKEIAGIEKTVKLLAEILWG